MAGVLARELRLQIMLSPEELAAVDDSRFQQRMPARAAAVRELLRLGLNAQGIVAAEGNRPSVAYGVLDRCGPKQEWK